ncbi:MAG: cellulose synthase operon protein YhjQ/BcsQ [Chitinivorax sp.]
MADWQADQAAGLRKLIARDRTRSICFNGGRGGTGTTSVVINLARAMADQGKHVLVLDEHIGTHNIATRCGLRGGIDLEQVLRQRLPLAKALQGLPGGGELMQISASPESLAKLNAYEEDRLAFEFSQLTSTVDLILVDARSAATNPLPSLNLAAEENVVVISNRAESITDAYTIIKLLHREYGQHRFRVLISRVNSLSEAQALFRRLVEVAGRYIDVSLRLIGFVPEDDRLARANRLLQPVVSAFPDADSSCAFVQLAAAMETWPQPAGMLTTPTSFVHRLIQSSRALAEGMNH